jgi:hypothetical protein
MFPQPLIRNWARRLIASEVDADAPSEQIELATLRAYEKLRRQLCAPSELTLFRRSLLVLCLWPSRNFQGSVRCR